MRLLKSIMIVTLSGLIPFLQPEQVFGQSSSIVSNYFRLSTPNFDVILEGDVNQVQKLNFSQLKVMLEQSGEEHLKWNLVSGNNRRFLMKLADSQDTLSLKSWDIPFDQLFIVYGSDSVTIRLREVAQPGVIYSDTYIENRRGRVLIEIPMFYELVNVLFALSEYAGSESGLEFRNSDYFQKVREYFSSYKSHKAVEHLNLMFANSSGPDNKNRLYYNLRADALSYKMTEKGEVKESEVFQNLGGRYQLSSLLPVIQSFAVESSFIDFYKSNLPYYEKTIDLTAALAKPLQMWKWLEGKSEEKIDGVRVIITSITNGIHNIKTYKDNGFTEVLLFISSPLKGADEGGYGRSLFTELDHFYVNPLGIKQKDAISEAMPDISLWFLRGTSLYDSSLQVFLEYMTWGLFSLYTQDQLPINQVQALRQRVVSFMVNNRGFLKFEAFENQLVDLYQRFPEMNLEQMVSKMIKWTKEQH